MGDCGRRGSRRMGTASRYGRISGSTSALRGSERFFHLDGVWDAVDANLDTGKGGLEDEGAEVVNGWRGGGGGGLYGRFTRSCLSSRTSLGGERKRRSATSQRRAL